MANFNSIKTDILAVLDSNLTAPDQATAKDALADEIAQVVVDAVSQGATNMTANITGLTVNVQGTPTPVTGTITFSTSIQ